MVKQLLFSETTCPYWNTAHNDDRSNRDLRLRGSNSARFLFTGSTYKSRVTKSIRPETNLLYKLRSCRRQLVTKPFHETCERSAYFEIRSNTNRNRPLYFTKYMSRVIRAHKHLNSIKTLFIKCLFKRSKVGLSCHEIKCLAYTRGRLQRALGATTSPNCISRLLPLPKGISPHLGQLKRGSDQG